MTTDVQAGDFDIHAEPLRMPLHWWQGLLQAEAGKDIDPAARLPMVKSGLLAEDGRTLAPTAHELLRGRRGATWTIEAFTLTPTSAATMCLDVGPAETTAVVTRDGEAVATLLPSEAVPTRLAMYLALGPRPFQEMEPVIAPSSLMTCFDDPSAAASLGSDLVTSFALAAPTIADAVEDGDWRVSATLAWESDGPRGPGIMMLDTRSGLFVVTHEGSVTHLNAVSTFQAWRVLTALMGGLTRRGA